MNSSWLRKHGTSNSIAPLLNESAISYYFSDQLLSEILKRLPVKSLLRCRCVEKSWYNLIQSPYFINLHLNYMHKKSCELLLFETIYSHTLSFRFDEQGCQEYYKVEKDPNLPVRPSWYATSYGLICLSTIFGDVRSFYWGDIYLWNPLVNKCRTLPHPPPTRTRVPLRFQTDFLWAALAFGFLPNSNDYVVIKMINYRWKNKADEVIELTMICIYSLITNSWRHVHRDIDLDDNWDPDDWVFVDGAAYWRAVTKERVAILACFDTKNDVLQQISLPQKPTSGWTNPTLHQFGESVAYFVQDVEWNAFNMWVLKRASENEFVWEKKITVDLEENINPEILGLRNNGEILLSKYNERGLISYDVDKDEPKDFVDSWDCWDSAAAIDKVMDYMDVDDNPPTPFTVFPFKESLVLLDD